MDLFLGISVVPLIIDLDPEFLLTKILVITVPNLFIDLIFFSLNITGFLCNIFFKLIHIII